MPISRTRGRARVQTPRPLPPPKTIIRCAEIVVALVLREYTLEGDCIGERVTDPTKIFRATTPDVWAAVDRDLVHARDTAAAPVPPSVAPASTNGTRTRA